jgi:hypothetical protein
LTALRLQAGHVLAGKYSVRAPLGYGGVTATYAAVLASGRPVAVKLFSPQLADRSDVLSALQHAAGVTNALPADATAPILDVGFDPQTRSPFTVTEPMPVPSLLDAVRAGPMAPADVAVVLRGVGFAVDAAHAQRLAHGGLKPQNVFVGPSTAPGQRLVKVIDFGVSVARAALPTDEGRWVAAPWIAPEQMQPMPGAPDGPAADVFSAGLLAFFAATGRSYWRSCQGPTPDLASWQQEILAPRVSPAARALELGVQLPAGFDTVLARALAPDPASRHGSVGELASALAIASQGAVVGPPATAPATPAPAQAVMAVETLEGAAPRSRTGLFVGLAVGALLLIGGAIAAVAMLRKPAPAATSAGAPSASAAAVVAPSNAPVASAPASVAAPAEAVPDAAAAPALEAEASAPESAQLTVQCVPDCDTVTIDDEVLDAGLADPQTLAPGAHTLSVAKATYLSQTRKITLKAGQKEKASFFLSRPGPAPSRPCGKFLQRCP